MTRAAWSPPKSDTGTQGAAGRQLTHSGSGLLSRRMKSFTQTRSCPRETRYQAGYTAGTPTERRMVATVGSFLARFRRSASWIGFNKSSSLICRR